jgi:type II restriction/modification system DNA methylase subunit YeeA
MDAAGHANPRVVTPAEGQMRPEILSEAVAGVVGDEVPPATAAQVRALLDGGAPSRDPQGEAYRLLVVAACNHWHAAMPFMFEPIADWTELLMPEDLLSPGSILVKLRAAMTDGACQDVEIIGWLYQFYISEKKDEVFAGLKKNIKIEPEDIPAATQLFTPHWIVRYLVENSLGRLWLLNRPASKLAAQMPYYIAPAEPETDFLRIGKPENIKVCDPACGSGHMLTYAFDLLYAIYEEEGYDPAEIPGLILTNNLYGIEIDGRAGALAAFALAMKAAARRKRFLRKSVQPNVCVLENVTFAKGELDEYVQEAGRDLFTADLRQTLTQFAEATNFGSLIVPKLADVAEVRRIIERRDVGNNLFLRDVHARVQTVLRMAEYLSAGYHVVVANPPYMGAKNMNERLKAWAESSYPEGKSDLMSCFMDACSRLALRQGFWGMINLPSWMFLSSFDTFRRNFLDSNAICSLLHLGRGIFGSDFGSVAFVVSNSRPRPEQSAVYRRLFVEHVEVRPPEMIQEIFLDRHFGAYVAKQMSFSAIPGSPIAYWVSEKVRELFARNPKIGGRIEAKQGVATADNARFLRQWWEPGISRGIFNAKDQNEVLSSNKKWVSYNKGGEFRRWYGNQEFVLNWENNGEDLYDFRPKSVIRNPEYFFRRSVSWSDVTTGGTAFRLYPQGFIFDSTGHSAFPTKSYDEEQILCFANTKIAQNLFNIINPTIHLHVGYFKDIPALSIDEYAAKKIATRAVAIARTDWNSCETSWEFTTFPLLSLDHRQPTLTDTYAHLCAQWDGMTAEMQRLEEENNRLFIEAYGLQDELTSDVPIEKISLTCNPAFRYGKKSDADLEALLRADTMREFVSYAVGCMFGRYSIDEPGLIVADQGATLDDYLDRNPVPKFEPAAGNVIPVLDGDWFADDVAARFRTFLRVTFGEARFADNLAFVQDALGKDIGKYFVRDFFNDHVKRYKKRPIYWLFTSPKGTFNALIYMHRYRPDTVSTVLNDYLRPFRGKLEAHRRAQEAQSISGDATAGQKTKALKAIEAVRQQIEELDAWERDVLYPLATQRIEIDLDDGVKANYPKFGAALKPIKGLNDAED